ncbi:MAG: hypothetical protein R3C11_16620 [Planctomycetaceae bacterium]
MTRQRIRPSVKRTAYENCPCCHGSGLVKSAEIMAVDVMRILLTTASSSDEISTIQVEIHERVANYLNNRKRRQIMSLEEEFNLTVSIRASSDVGPEHVVLQCLDDIGHEIKNLSHATSKTAV